MELWAGSRTENEIKKSGNLQAAKLQAKQWKFNDKINLKREEKKSLTGPTTLES